MSFDLRLYFREDKTGYQWAEAGAPLSVLPMLACSVLVGAPVREQERAAAGGEGEPEHGGGADARVGPVKAAVARGDPYDCGCAAGVIPAAGGGL